MLPRVAITVFSGLLTGCGFETRSDDYRCAGPDDCDDGRVCRDGWCVVAGGLADASDTDAPYERPDADDTDASPAIDAAPTFALSFDGEDDFVRVDRELADDFTIEAWIRTTASLSGSEIWRGRGVVYAGVTGEADDFGTAVLNDHFAFGTGNPDTVIESTSEVTTGEWVHVAAVRERSTGTIRVLVNGVEERSTNASKRPLDAPQHIDIGGNTLSGHYFDGTIDEVRFWSIARSELEIQATMSTPLSGADAGLVGYWRFDEGTGDIAGDSSSAGNDGSLGDSPGASPDWVTPGAPGF